MYKNIFIIGAPRCGKTTLARKIAKEKGYSLVSIDDFVCAFKNLNQTELYIPGNTDATAKNIEPFMEIYLKEISEGPNFYNGIKTVIEGTYFDFEKLIPYIRNSKLNDKYYILGLTQNEITSNELFNNIKKYDTEDDWTYYIKDEDLIHDVDYFIERNKYFNNKFIEYKIDSYDTSYNREDVLNKIIETLDEKCN